MIFKGTGGSFAPDTPRVDALMGKRLQARGFAGTRDKSICLYGSTSKEHALEYARNGDEAHLKALYPQPGSIVSWVDGSRDLLLHFASHLSDMYWGGIYHYKGINFGSLVRDMAGTVDIAETYLSMGRQKRAIGAMIDLFLDDIEVRELLVDDLEALTDILSGHDGEVWITGPCMVKDFAFVQAKDLVTP